jgi:predicted dehydrogenase
MQRIGIIGLGSVFAGPYRNLIRRLAQDDLVTVSAVYDIDDSKGEAGARLFGAAKAASAEAVIARDDVDIVLILTAMNAHGPLARAGLEGGKHVLVEKPMATSLDEAGELVELSRSSPGMLVCAPHIVLSKTYREIHRRVGEGAIGSVVLARARYGWAGPWWGRWFYEAGGGSLFDLGVYNLTSLCGFMGSVRRVTALVGTAIPRRVVEGELMDVKVDDNAHVLLDFGESRFASIACGFTMQKYRSPAIELYGTEGVLQLLGDDWAPEGFEQWLNSRGVWEVVPEAEPNWPWTFGLQHLVECAGAGRRPVNRPEHAYHALEVMLAAKRSAAEGRAIEIESSFPAIDYSSIDEAAVDDRRQHDPRSLV